MDGAASKENHFWAAGALNVIFLSLPFFTLIWLT
jgi:hypothetical protein